MVGHCSTVVMIVHFHTLVSTGEDGGTWFLDLKSKGGRVGHGEPPERADVVMSMTTDDFVRMFTGKFSTPLVHLFHVLDIPLSPFLDNQGSAMLLTGRALC